MQNFGGTNKEHYGMLWYFWSGQLMVNHAQSARTENMNECGAGDLSAINVNF